MSTITATATLFILAIIIVTSSMAATTTLVRATTTTATNTNNTTTTSPTIPLSSGIDLSSEPVYQQLSRTTNVSPINQTHIQFTVSGNGTLVLPNGPINITGTGSTIASKMGTLIGERVLNTEDGTENATATLYGIARFDTEEQETGKGIVIATVHTNSTGILAPLNNTIVAGIVDIRPNGESLVTFWEWEDEIQQQGSDTSSPIQ